MMWTFLTFVQIQQSYITKSIKNALWSYRIYMKTYLIVAQKWDYIYFRKLYIHYISGTVISSSVIQNPPCQDNRFVRIHMRTNRKCLRNMLLFISRYHKSCFKHNLKCNRTFPLVKDFQTLCKVAKLQIYSKDLPLTSFESSIENLSLI